MTRIEAAPATLGPAKPGVASLGPVPLGALPLDGETPATETAEGAAQESGAAAPALCERDCADDYRSIFENAVVGIYQTTVDGRYLRVNRALARMYGYGSPEELIASLTDIASELYVDPSSRPHFTAEMVAKGEIDDFEALIYRKDRSTIWIKESARCVRDAAGRIRYYEGIVRDISVRKLAETRIRQFATVFDSIAEGILIIDCAGIVRAANPAYEAITGHSLAGVIDVRPALVADEFYETGFVDSIFKQAAETGRWRGEATCLHAQGRFFPAWLSVAAVRGPNNEVEHFVLVCSDLTQARQHEDRIRYQANFDSLTGLPNRWLIRDRLDQAISHARTSHGRVAIAFLDLDRFKQVNDSLGHHTGDELLKQVGRRLRSSMRVTDTVGRFGGDEFVAICPDIPDRQAGSAIARKMLYAFSEPFDLFGKEYFVTPSIGITFFPEDGNDADGLMRNADLAMYHAKVNPPGAFSLYSAEMKHRSEQRLTLENDLRLAVARREFVLYFQPIIALDSGRVASAEALIRWQHPTLGMIPPAQFIPVAEETGMISSIGYWTLRRACIQLRQWRAAGLAIDGVSVNLSPRQFHDALLIEVIARILEETGLEAGRLELELTEGAMIADLDRAVATLSGLKKLGVRLSIDDFGTGYSSLAYLKRFPIDCLKIDRSFIHDLETDLTDAAIVDTVVGMARSLGFAVVAEGVETECQANMLRERRCTLAQGYLFSPPLAPQDLVDYLTRHTQSPPRPGRV
ncbi:MAG: EAL domain-containing protein [Azospirillum sp.]|nr:EAL domain-containing protein [Azospirillum sp.]